MTIADYTQDAEYQALLRGVLEAPDDDAPRLVLSDWIEEQERQNTCETCEGRGQPPVPKDASSRLASYRIPKCQACDGRGAVSNGAAVRADYIRRYVAAPEDWYSCNGLYLTGVAGLGLEGIYRRGFVSEIRLPCAAFVGRPCGMCNGGGSLYSIPGYASGDMTEVKSPCPTCGGAKYRDGLAASLFAAHPITRVVLTDREPYKGDAGTHAAWFPRRGYAASSHDSDPNLIPDEIFPLIKGEIETRNGIALISDEEISRHQDDSSALAALSNACVAYGRSLAGLPPIT